LILARWRRSKISRFKGVARRFFQNFAELAAPLTDKLIKKAMEAMRRLKEAFMTTAVLRHTDSKKIYFLQCNASKKAEEGKGSTFFFLKLNPCQRNYSVTEECYAIKRFRPYIRVKENFQ